MQRLRPIATSLLLATLLLASPLRAETVGELVGELARAFRVMERRADRLVRRLSEDDEGRSTAARRELDRLERDFDRRLRELEEIRPELPDAPELRAGLAEIEAVARRFHRTVRRDRRGPSPAQPAGHGTPGFPRESDARRLLAEADRLLAQEPSTARSEKPSGRARCHIDLPPASSLDPGEMELELRVVESGSVDGAPLVDRHDLRSLEWGFRFGLGSTWTGRLILPSWHVDTTLAAGPVLSFHSSLTEVAAGEIWWTRPGRRLWELSAGFSSLSVLRDESGRRAVVANLTANTIPPVDLSRYRHQSVALRRGAGRFRPGFQLRHGDLNRPKEKIDVLVTTFSLEALLRRDWAACVEFGRIFPSWDWTTPVPIPDPEDENYLSAALAWSRGDWSARLEGRFLDQHGIGSHRWDLCVTWRP